jgi:hypothetical protein
MGSTWLVSLLLAPLSTASQLIEMLWHKLEYEWPQSDGYASEQQLFYATPQTLATVGRSLSTNVSDSSLGLT